VWVLYMSHIPGYPWICNSFGLSRGVLEPYPGDAKGQRYTAERKTHRENVPRCFWRKMEWVMAPALWCVPPHSV
jgi:hypothetical protein